MALFLIVVQAHFIMNNVFEGMIWFFLPASLVITNDIFAYVCGIAFGRTQLIKLSPKKTVEGFVGAWIMTVLFGMVFSTVLIRSKYFICPVNDLGANVFTGLECDPNPVFLPRTYQLPDLFFLPPRAAHWSVTAAPIQFHTFIFATFASLIAPFGGFFASGLKRTFKIKDFGHSIPGHGGMTDRMDCQFIMGFFTYMYYHTFIAMHKVSLGRVMEIAITGLTPDEQIELVRGMARYLGNQGQVGQNVSQRRFLATKIPVLLLTQPPPRFCRVSTALSARGGKRLLGRAREENQGRFRPRWDALGRGRSRTLR
ncbi:hypothetical protein VTK73DRAFT_3400 [Phialemonium thermophilum]|uniref:Phosphatidate cytidylyltransferase n=1 Tax=Phialemonium thermophilum TaxID=223376 RepID=A0ABR3VIZ7_9PEZI